MAAEGWPGVLNSVGIREKIADSKVLAVGAGGIGCELLKSLVLSGFRNIELIDLDTIETSNLNRQFLFRKHHVGKSKAMVAAEVVQSFAPAAKIIAHQANIKEPRFDLEYLKGFDIVLNGLDNMEARRHVNRLCVASNRPLIESGTAGYLGQVTVHLKGETECYECTTKAAPKTYPICTLRNTPDKPIHCIVWAKDMLFARLFDKADTVTDLDEAATPNGDGEAEADGTKAAAAAAEATAAEAAAFVQQPGEGPLEYAARIFERVYKTDIVRLVAIGDLWKSRPAPKPLHLSDLVPDQPSLAQTLSSSSSSSSSAAKALGLADQTTWSPQDNARVFLLALAMFLEHRGSELGAVTFDKDDDLAVDFVTSASNLRSLCYGIPTQSSFAARGMAGNIIHAIATTNAIVSGMIVIEAIKVLAGLRGSCQTSYLNEEAKLTGRKRAPLQMLIGNEQPPKPKPGCVVCGKAQLLVKVDVESMTLKAFISKLLKGRLAVNEPNLRTDAGFFYEEGYGLEEDEVAENQQHLSKTLANLPGGGLREGSILIVQDQSQHFNVDIIIQHKTDLSEEDAPDGFLVEGVIPAAAAAAEQDTSGKVEAGDGDGAAAAGGGRKRHRPDEGETADGKVQLVDSRGQAAAAGAGEEGAGPSNKRAKQRNDAEANGGGTAAAVQDEDGVIEISDDDGEPTGVATADDADDVVVIDD